MPEPALVSDCCGALVRPVGDVTQCGGCGKPCDGTTRVALPDAVVARAVQAATDTGFHVSMAEARFMLDAVVEDIRAQGAAAERARIANLIGAMAVRLNLDELAKLADDLLDGDGDPAVTHEEVLAACPDVEQWLAEDDKNDGKGKEER